MTHNIAVIGGDGIGPEVTAEAVKVVRAAGVDIATTEFDLGGQRYLRDGEILSDATLDELRAFDCILLGAVGTPEVPPGVIERGLLLKMRFDLDLYINQRPFLGTAPGETAAQMMDRYMGYMWPKLLTRACHPTVMGNAIAPALDVVGIENARNWDAGALMRYRSRRSMMEIIANVAQEESHRFKLAAMEKTIAFPIETRIHLGDARVLLGLLLLSLTALLDSILLSRKSSHP